jgi:hypothetical protein
MGDILSYHIAGIFSQKATVLRDGLLYASTAKSTDHVLVAQVSVLSCLPAN